MKRLRLGAPALPPHLILFLVLSISGLLLFIAVSKALIAYDPVIEWDREVVTAFYEWDQPALVTVFKVIADVAKLLNYGLGVGVGLYLIWRREWALLAVWILVAGGGELLSLGLKEWFARPRPVFDHPAATENTYSYPSGHAMLATIIQGSLAYCAIRRIPRPRARVLIAAGMGLVLALIGLSRLMLNVHYPTDVLGGYTLGGLWLLVCWVALAITLRPDTA